MAAEPSVELEVIEEAVFDKADKGGAVDGASFMFLWLRICLIVIGPGSAKADLNAENLVGHIAKSV